MYGSQKRYLDISLTSGFPREGSNLYPHRMALWLQQLPALIDHRAVVETARKSYRGLRREIKSKLLFEFRGVKYGEAKRFGKPSPEIKESRGMKQVTDASTFGPACLQFVIPGYNSYLNFSEDCLFLNIYVPETLQPSEAKPVMIWIHGGGYLMGAGNMYDGSYLALRGDVIVVTMNYRLGPFGFLSTGNVYCLGNYGLWDQQLAIQWTRDNIAYFGGNPGAITLFGESAGASSVGLQAVSTLNAGLFHRVIMQSGVMMAPWAVEKDPLSYAVLLGERLNCTGTNHNRAIGHKSMVDCISSLDAATIQNAVDSLPVTSLLFTSHFAPVVDGDFIRDLPSNLLSNTNSASFDLYRNIDVMVGTTNNEGSVFVNLNLPAFQKELGFNVTNGIPFRILYEKLAPLIATEYYAGFADVAMAIYERYNESEKFADLTVESMRILEVLGDLEFVAPAMKALNMHTKAGNSSTYQYLFSNEPEHEYIHYPSWVGGARHTEELPFIFGLQMLGKNLNFTSREIKLSNVMMDLWASFAKTG